MEHENLFDRLLEIIEEIRRIDEEHPIDSSEELDPRAAQLIIEGKQIKNELDPVMRKIYREHPAELFGWDKVVLAFDELDNRRKTKEENPDAWAYSTSDERKAEIAKLVATGDQLIREKLDPWAREAFRDDRKLLADWERLMQSYYDLDKEEPDESESDS